MNKILKTLTVTVLLGALIQAACEAQTPGLTGTASGTATTYGGSVGFEFSLSSSQTLSGLGLYDVNSTDNGTQEVGLYSITGSLLATANVTIASANVGTYVFSNAITDSNGFSGLLTSGTDYVIGYDSATAAYLDDGLVSPTTSPGVTLLASRYSSTSGFSFPDTTDHTPAQNNGGLAYTGPNFEFGGAAAVPEPSSYALLGAGLLALFFLGRRARQKS